MNFPSIEYSVIPYELKVNLEVSFTKLKNAVPVETMDNKRIKIARYNV